MCGDSPRNGAAAISSSRFRDPIGSRWFLVQSCPAAHGGSHKDWPGAAAPSERFPDLRLAFPPHRRCDSAMHAANYTVQEAPV